MTGLSCAGLAGLGHGRDGSGAWGRRERAWVPGAARYPRRGAGMTGLSCAGMTGSLARGLAGLERGGDEALLRGVTEEWALR